METTANDNTRAIRDGLRALKGDARDLGRQLKPAGKQELDNLLADVDELMSRVSDSLDPEISRLRLKIQDSLADARSMLSDSADRVQRQVREAVHAGERYVGNNPWTSVGVAALAGVTLGFLIGRR